MTDSERYEARRNTYLVRKLQIAEDLLKWIQESSFSREPVKEAITKYFDGSW